MLITGGALPLPVSWLPGHGLWSRRRPIIIRGLTTQIHIVYISGQWPLSGEAPAGVTTSPQIQLAGNRHQSLLGSVLFFFRRIEFHLTALHSARF